LQYNLTFVFEQFPSEWFNQSGGTMANLNQALHQLRQEHHKAQQEVQKLQLAISAIEGLDQRNGSSSGRRSSGGRVVSATARARMAAAQRARWAKVRGQSRASKGPTPVRSNRLSPAARRKIAAAQKARWARFRAEQAKKAA
jgi:hypothetical protein